MGDLKQLFEDLDLLDAPVSWSEVKRRQPGPPMGDPERRSRLLTVGVALAIGAAGISVVLRAFVFVPAQRPNAAPPANSKIAFVSAARGNHAALWTVRPDGTGLTRLPGLPGRAADPSWSPDGRRLVFAYAPQAGSHTSLYMVNQDGSGVRRLTRCQEPTCLQDDEPAWSPDGTEIAFVRNEDIYVMNADGSHLRRLTHATTPLGDGQPAWSPNGQEIAFIVLRVQPYDLPAIYVMNADGTNITRLTNCLPGCVDTQPSWSPEGARIAFSRNGDISVMNADGTGARRLTECFTIPGCVSAGGPVWSPDGKEIALWVEGHDSNRQLYVMHANGTDVQPLIPKTSDDCCLAWQPVAAPQSGRFYSRTRTSDGLTLLVPSGWTFRAYPEPTDESNPKIPLAMGTWAFSDQVIDRGPIPSGQVLIDIEEWAPPYAPGFPKPKTRNYPLQPIRFVLPAKPNSGLPFAAGRSIGYLTQFRAAGRFFGVRISVAQPLSEAMRREVEGILSSLTVRPRTPG